ncbi:hypothetical protein PAMC26510_29470 [Caballeronia sordidicola]|uniref:Uncharacterized protein n=1 Tax=Caballeronia sordidicola TaxID=196367 RepID=A0A242MAD9_CABSO|nr:hypothetical protein PAMC26510_29470 [Caballeronia sordidicola]
MRLRSIFDQLVHELRRYNMLWGLNANSANTLQFERIYREYPALPEDRFNGVQISPEEAARSRQSSRHA